MNRTPILLRSLFAFFVIAVFVWSMFPFREADFYDTFKGLTADTDDAKAKAEKLVDNAKVKAVKESARYPYPSTALEAAARDQNVALIDIVNPTAKNKLKLKTDSDVTSLVRKNAAGSIRLGIDLNGGAEFMLKLEPDPSKKEEVKGNFDKFRDNAIETLRKRLETQKFYECDIAPAGADLVSVRVPVVTKDDKANLEKLILRSAKLEFRLVPVEETPGQLSNVIQQIEAFAKSKGFSAEKFYKLDENSVQQLYESFISEHPDMTLKEDPRAKEGTSLDGFDLLFVDDLDTGRRSYDLVAKKVEIYGDEIKDASVRMTQYGQREIALSFTTKGAKQFGEVTSNNVKRRLAIVLDGKLYSAPVLQCAITGGEAQITGSFSEDEAKSVADALVSGSLPFKISIESRSDIEPTVGTETIQKSIWSGIIGTLLVMLFMIIYYRIAGIVADISLLVNAAVMLGAIAAFDVTLTLPGIAGIVLTLGMAVDANVLIYERIREEIKQGKSVANAVNIGFDRAFSAIFDSNLTTLFVALILFWQGSGSIKGFAITLAIGIFTTMFTAVFLTRILFDCIIRVFGTKLHKLTMMEFCRDPRINFIKARKVMFGISIVMIVGSFVLMFVRGRDILGIDFTGGTQIIVTCVPKQADTKQIAASDVEEYLNKHGYDAKATYKTASGASSDNVKLLEIIVRDTGKSTVSEELGSQIITKMNAAYPDVEITKKSQSVLGALIGDTFTRSAIWALIWAMVGMIVYLVIRFQFSYSIAANVALVHDVIISMGIYLAFGGQLTLQVVASLLTLIGYSVNDTIVTFDRQRENLTLLSGKTYFDVVNVSINQTLGRTILTSLSVVLILVAQLIFGGEGIRDFIAVMLIGCVVGCYSSICISPTITAYWHRKERNISDEHKVTTLEEPAEKTAKA